MRKCFAVFILLISVSLLFADSTLTIEGAVPERGSTATFPVTVDLSGGEGSESYISVGFSTDMNLDKLISPTSTPSPVDTFFLSTDQESGAADNANNPLYAYWIIRSGQKVNIDINLSGAMINDSETDSLNWVVVFESNDDEKQNKVQIAGNGEEGYSQRQKVRVFETPEDATIGIAGATQLSIATESYLDKEPGAYSGTIVMTVSPKEEA